ncbi:MAG: cation diffusion facilitator family transporter [Peptostreptococcaceae bacterium]|nr:cation diffusion facilitator family transporter [Peptostreptococcaceae bacterium]
MTRLLIRIFIKDADNTKDPHVVKKYGYLCGFVGVATNTLLALIKLFIGLSIHSIAVMVDAVNNLSDIGASIVTLVGFYVAGKPADEEHPFGHGRAEYLSALVLSMMVIVVGIQFLRTSWQRIVDPIEIDHGSLTQVLLIFSVLLKIWQSKLYKVIGTKINSKTLIAAALDSTSDVATTSIIILSLVVDRSTSIPIDGYIGLIVSILIIYNGWNIVKDVIDPILGTMPDPEQCDEIISTLMSCEGIMGYHDLIIHNYGAGTILATVHAEVQDNLGLLEAHDIIDNAEKVIANNLKIGILIHMDPINFDDPEIKKIFDETKSFAQTIDPSIDIHDFRIVKKAHSEAIFDMVVPIKFSETTIDKTKRSVINFLEREHGISKVFISLERGNIIVGNDLG